MAVSLLRRVAATAPVPVYPVAGVGGRAALANLAADDRVELVSSPRRATILLIAGALPRQLLTPLGVVHDQLPAPRATLWWSSRSIGGLEPGVPGHELARADDDVVAVLQALHRDVVTGRRASAPGVLPPAPPVAWQGIGPHGQGGQGMMGGVPYGRPMAMTGPDLRDGLSLDQVTLPLGPFLPFLPAGLGLRVTVQGDLIQRATVEDNPFRALTPTSTGIGGALDDDPFARAQQAPARIADLELARARSHLRWLATLLEVQNLPSLATRVRRLARDLAPDDGNQLRRLGRRLVGSRTLAAATRGVGRLDGDLLDRLPPGPIRRAAAGRDGRTDAGTVDLAADARSRAPGYRGLDFTAVTQEGGDAEARWRQRLEEASQALELAARAGDRTTDPDAPLETPQGTWDPAVAQGPGSAPAALLSDLLPGLEWGDAITTLVSLDIELAAGARRDIASGAPGRGGQGRGAA